MVIFNKNKKENTKTIPIVENGTPKSETVEVEDEWIWVEGIKGMSKDMTGKNDFQFEIGKTYVFDGEPRLGECGFHFSTEFEYAKRHYCATTSRFFRVRGLVRKSCYENSEDRLSNLYGFSYRSVYDVGRLVSKEIEIVSEFTDDEYLNIFHGYNYSSVKTINDVREVHELGGVHEYINSKIRKLMLKYGYSEIFTQLVIGENNNSEDIEKILLLIEALAVEGVSKDMSVYMLLKRQ